MFLPPAKSSKLKNMAFNFLDLFRELRRLEAA